MTRTLITVEAQAIHYFDGEVKTRKCHYFVQNTNEKTIAKARREYEDEYDCKIVKSTEKIGKVTTSMSEETWLANCEYGDFMPLENSDDAAIRPTENA